MNGKWYFGTLLLILALLGVGVGGFVAPNQEIVVQFNGNTVSDAEAQQAIALVKEQLQTVGAENIQVLEGAHGQLTITYYSEVDFRRVQELLSGEGALIIDYTSPSNEDPPSHFPMDASGDSYQFNVSEIGGTSNMTPDLEGTLLEFKSGHDRSSHQDFYTSNVEITVDQKTPLDQLALNAYATKALFIDNTSYIIPEVRAGPFTYGNC